MPEPQPCASETLSSKELSIQPLALAGLYWPWAECGEDGTGPGPSGHSHLGPASADSNPGSACWGMEARDVEPGGQNEAIIDQPHQTSSRSRPGP